MVRSSSRDAPVVAATGLTRRFGEKVAVDGLDLVVGRGEVLALLGHNGAGKTTTIRILAGVLTPTAGSARVFGLSPFADGPAVRSRLGVLPENHALEERLTARQNLRYYADVYGYPRERVDGRIAEMLTRFGLTDAADRKVGGFSKGMKQRLALARALQHEPELLFLDEPTSGLDPVASREVTASLREQSAGEGRTVVLCTHDLGLAQAVCDRVAVMRSGAVVAIGTPAELAGRLPGRLIVEVGLGEGKRALESVRAAFPDAAVELAPVGDELTIDHLPAGSAPRVVALLVGSELSVYRVEPVRATLQDVYFSIYGEGG